MNTAKRYIVSAICAIAAIAAVAAVCFKIKDNDNEFDKYRYTTCVLIDNGLYEEARATASETLAIREDEAVRTLVAVSYMLEGREEKAEKYVQVYLDGAKTEEAKDLLVLMQESDTTRVDYLYIVEDISSEIDTDRELRKRVKAIVEAKSFLAGNQSDTGIEEILEDLEEYEDEAVLRLCAQLEAKKGDKDAAIKAAAEAAKLSESLTDKIAVANLAAAGAILDDWDIDDNTDDIDDRLNELEDEISETKEKIYEEDEDSFFSKKDKYEEELKTLQKEKEELLIERGAASYRRAVNYLLAIRNADSEESVEYQLALSRMYFYCGSEAESELAFENAMKLARGEAVGEYAAQKLNDYIESSINAEISEAELRLAKHNLIAAITENVIAEEDTLRGDGKKYGDFIEEILEDKAEGMSVGYVNAREFPDIKVNINASGEVEQLLLNGGILSVYDSGELIENVKVSRAVTEEEDTINVCLVLDVSGSMEGDSMNASVSAAKYFVKMISSDVNAGLVVFSSEARTECAMTNSGGMITKALENIYADGGTDIGAGIDKAVEELAEMKGRKVIILLSDGQDGEDAIISAENAKTQGIQIFALSLEGSDSAYLEKLTDITGGRMFDISDASKLGGVYSILNQYMSNSIVLEYTVKSNIDEYDRSISITTNDGSFEEEEYIVGLSDDYYEREEEREISSDLYRQTGGSYSE